MELEYEEAMTGKFYKTAGNLKRNGDKWHKRNEKKTLEKSNKLERVFNANTIKYLNSNLLDIDSRQFYR